MQASTLRNRVSAALLAFAWDEWAQMGVLAAPHRESPWAQDPEALLVFTFEVARDDPRLFDEVLDWLALNESLVSARRLRAICQDPTDERLVEAALTWVGQQRRGRAPTSAQGRADQVSERLFRELRSPIRDEDPAFAAYGFRRQRAVPSEKSQAPDPTRPINFAFRLRHLLGLSARAEVVRCLLTLEAPWATAAVVARSAGYAKRNVQDALASLRAAGLVSMTAVGAEQRYAVDHAHWADFLDLRSLPSQRDWPQLLGASRRILRWLDQGGLDELSLYMRASRARDLLEEVHGDLAYAGVPVHFGNTTKDSWDALIETTELALSATHAQESRSSLASSREGRVEHRPAARFEVYHSQAGAFAWRIRAANGQIVAESPEQFASRATALRAARAVRDNAGELHYDLVEESPGIYRWRALADGGLLAVSGDAFASRSNARRSASRVRDIAAQAAVAADDG